MGRARRVRVGRWMGWRVRNEAMGRNYGLGLFNGSKAQDMKDAVSSQCRAL